MDFELSEDQELLRRGLRELFERSCDIRGVREVAYEGDGFDRDLWQSLHEAGWTRATLPEDLGGQSLRFEDAIIIAEEAGRAVAPVPLTTTLLASRLAEKATEGPGRELLLSRIAAGASGTLALDGGTSASNGTHAGITATRAGDAWRLEGSQRFVPHGPNADIAIVAAPRDGHYEGFVIETSATGVTWTDLNAMDRTVHQYELSLAGASGTPLFDSVDSRPALESLVDEWRVLLAAETLGTCGRILELSVAYAKNRVQFGRPIGVNQAVKWRLADMGAAVDRMRAAVYHAAVKIDADAEDRALAAAMAKAATAEPGAFVGTQGIHVHGGIGFTWEHDLHIYFKRVKSNELLLGDGMAMLERVADAVL